MVFHQQGTGFREPSGAVFGKQRLERGAIANVFGGTGCALLDEALPDTLAGGFDDGGVNGFFADLGHGSFQVGVHAVVFGIHAKPPR